MKIALIIPVYNERKHIKKVLKQALKQKIPVYVIDDGSTDKSLVEIEKIRNENLNILIHKINLGKGAALKTGAMAAFSDGADAVIFMDSDGQHKVEDLPKFIKALDKKFDVVFGTRNLSFGVPLVRYVGNKMASLLIAKMFHIYVSDLICGFRALTRKAFEKLNWESTGYGVETEIAVRTAKSGLKHCEVPVETVYYDTVKGVTILDAFGIFFEVLRWKLTV